MPMLPMIAAFAIHIRRLPLMFSRAAAVYEFAYAFTCLMRCRHADTLRRLMQPPRLLFSAITPCSRFTLRYATLPIPDSLRCFICRCLRFAVTLMSISPAYAFARRNMPRRHATRVSAA